MATHRDVKKRIVWQDIRPAQKPIPLEPIKKTRKINLFKPILRPFSLVAEILHKLKLKPSTHKSKRLIIVGAICTFVILFGAIYYLVSSQKTDGQTEKNNETTVGLTKGTPNYSTVVPTDKNIDSLGGWTRISPETSDPVFAYTDSIGSTPVIISEQPLPNDFKPDINARVRELAESFNANQKISVGGITAYIGTSKDGPQSVIFSKNDLLILMKSSSTISNDGWTAYINSLQ